MKAKCQSCSSCGMPLENAEDFAMGNPESPFCRYCVDEAGKLLPFETILDSNASYLRESQGLTEAASIKMAADLLKSQPAWKNTGA